MVICLLLSAKDTWKQSTKAIYQALKAHGSTFVEAKD